MKKLILGILIGIALSLGTISFASSAVKLIMVPEYIRNYKTLDLLKYMADLKDKELKEEIEVQIKETPPVKVPIKKNKFPITEFSA